MAHSASDTLSRPSAFNFATDVVDYWAKNDPSLLAMHWVSQDHTQQQKLTFAHFSRQSHRIASLFASLGIQTGAVSVVILPRLPQWWEIATASLRSGVVFCPCTTLLVDKDIEYRIQVSHASVFVGDQTSVAKALKVQRSCPSLKTVIQIGGKLPASTAAGVKLVDFDTALAAISQSSTFSTPSSLKPTTPALVFFTSGTTGPPKMVQHSHISYPLAHTLTGKHWLRLSPGKLYWNLSEQGWAKAAWSFFGTWNMGGALFVVDDRGAFSAIRLLETLHKFDITTLCAPPTAYRQLVLEESQRYFERHKPRKLEHCTGAGEPLNESVIRTWEQMTGGIQIYDGYGQTETILICANQKGNKVKYGSMGKPVVGVPLVVIDNEGQETADGVEGDIAVMLREEGEAEKDAFFGIFDGYVDMKTGKLDRRIKNLGGRKYYITGDRATRDTDGYFWFVGRSDDVINSAGYRIGPFEVESTLKLHPAVVESAVVASPDPQRDEVVKAFVVLTDSAAKKLADAIPDGKTASESPSGNDWANTQAARTLVKELQDFCKENAAPYKYPRKIEFVDASFLPKTISGKIKRAELKKLEKERYQKGKKPNL